MNETVFKEAQQLVSLGNLDYIINDPEFHFQKLKDLFQTFESFDVTTFKTDLIEIATDAINDSKYFKFEKLITDSEQNPLLSEFVLLLGKIFSYCDDKAFNKKQWNEYPDHRILARAQVTMRRWLLNFLKYKLGDEIDYKIEIGVQHIIDFIKDPEHQLNILSETHRQLISKKILEEEYDPENFCTDTIDSFFELLGDLANPLNRGYIVMRILYNTNIKKLWRDSIDGLITQDSTNWFEDYIADSNPDGYFILWNNKKPVGGKQTLDLLQQEIEDSGFYIYYFAEGLAQYRAHVIDFAYSLDTYNQKKQQWYENYNPYGYSESFEYYNDKENTRKANIVFLADEFVELEQGLPPSDFVCRGEDSMPFNGNMKAFEFASEFKLNQSLKGDISKNKIMTPLNTILYGPPGTGKTYNTIIKAAKIITGRDLEYNEAKAVFEPLLGDQVVFITFHQNYSYEDFVIGLRPKLDGSQLAFERHEGVFYKICDNARKNYNSWKEGLDATEPKFETVLFEYLKPLQTAGGEIEVKLEIGNKSFFITGSGGNMLQYRTDGGVKESLNVDTIKGLYSEGKSPTDSKHVYYTPLVKALKATAEKLRKVEVKVELKNYVLIIDEINRANISRVFGELITLLEKDKRLGNEHQMLVTLSNGERFSVPGNLYVLGTMNTADKSIALLDIALRRRFVFENMYPRPELVDELVPAPYNDFLKDLNKKILEKKGADFLIGHSYLMVDENEKLDFLSAMNQKIIPLLNEYFYNHRSVSILELLQSAITNVPGFTVEKDDYVGVVCKQTV